MKKISTISSGVLVAFLMTGLQAYAVTFTETNLNINYEIENNPYPGTFTDANLKSGSTVFNNTQYTITSATVDLTILNDTSLPVTLTIDGISASLTPSKSPQILSYILTPTEYDYIQTEDGTFNYGVVVDCELQSDGLVVNANPVTPPPSTAPDGGSTVLLLGGVVSALGLIKRKLA
jgi:hypothetical protein